MEVSELERTAAAERDLLERAVLERQDRAVAYVLSRVLEAGARGASSGAEHETGLTIPTSEGEVRDAG